MIGVASMSLYFLKYTLRHLFTVSRGDYYLSQSDFIIIIVCDIDRIINYAIMASLVWLLLLLLTIASTSSSADTTDSNVIPFS